MIELSRSKNIIKYCNWLAINSYPSFRYYDELHSWSVQSPDLFWASFTDFLRSDLGIDHRESALDRFSESDIALYTLENGALRGIPKRELQDHIDTELAPHKSFIDSNCVVMFAGTSSQRAVAWFLASQGMGAKWLGISPSIGGQIRTSCIELMNSRGLNVLYLTDDSTIERYATKTLPDSLLVSSNLCMLTSGTTGMPKLVFHGSGAVVNHLKELYLHLNAVRGEKILFLTEPGWMMWNWMLSALYLGVTPLVIRPIQFSVLARDCEFVSQMPVEIFGCSSYYANAMFRGTQRVFLPACNRIIVTGGKMSDVSFSRLSTISGSSLSSSLFNVSGGTELNGCIFIETLDHEKHQNRFASVGLGIQLLSDSQGGPSDLVIDARIPNLPIAIFSLDNRDQLGSYLSNGQINHPDQIQKDEKGWYIEGRSELIFKVNDVRISLDLLYQFLENRFALESVAAPIQTQDGNGLVLFYSFPRSGLDTVRVAREIGLELGSSYVPLEFIRVSEVRKTASGKKDEGYYRCLVRNMVYENGDLAGLFRQGQ